MYERLFFFKTAVNTMPQQGEVAEIVANILVFGRATEWTADCLIANK